MRINLKILTVAVLVTIIYSYFASRYIYNIKSSQLDEKYKETTYNIHEMLQTLINEKSEAILLLSLALSEDTHLKKLMLDKNVKQIDLASFSNKLKNNSSLHNIWFQLLLSDGTSLYRSWTKKHGDNVLFVRKDIAKVIQNPRVLSTISVGQYDMTFKSIVPIFEKGKFIGLIETIAKFNSVSIKMKQNGYENILLVDKKYKNQLRKKSVKDFIGEYYIATNHLISLSLNAQNLEHYLKIKKYSIENNLLITTYHLVDINGNDMAYFIITKDISTINISEIQNQKITLISIFILIYFIIFIVVYYIYFIKYKELLLEQKNILEDKVALKTQELQKKSEVLKFQAEHDVLTGLPNRMLFLDRLKQALRHAKRAHESVTVLFLDLDRFKEVNDTYGHEAGDALLKEVTKRLKHSVREEDTVARLGGDEFTILFRNLIQEDVIKLVTKIISIMQKPVIIDNHELYTTFSIGISNYPTDGDSCEELLRNADTAMYKAKESGRNQYHFYNNKLTQLAFERIELDKELHNALKNDEFEAYFQPKIDAQNNKVIGLESLVRWNHPIKGMIYPDKFISFAEEIGFIDSIDNYMMKTSLKQVLEWQQKGIECGKISVNLSSRQLNSKTYIQTLEQMLQEVGFNTKYLEIEITETHIMQDPTRAMKILNRIRALGISISIDDFGTGYSSLSYLKKLPVTKLKIDRSFVIGLPDDNDDVAIVKTIIMLAKNLHLEIIAEGVETKEQVEFLVQEGCENIQGYYFSKPLSKEDCEKFLVAKQKS